MKATKQYYLKYRNLFINLGLIDQVKRLDVHFELIFLYIKVILFKYYLYI